MIKCGHMRMRVTDAAWAGCNGDLRWPHPGALLMRGASTQKDGCVSFFL